MPAYGSRTSIAAAHPDPEIRPPEHESAAAAGPHRPRNSWRAAASIGPGRIGYAFSGPVTAAHKQELERTYSALAGQGCRFTRVYVGDYRTGLVFDRKGKVSGVEPEFLDYLDQLAAIANRHGVTVMFSLTDNAMVNGRRTEAHRAASRRERHRRLLSIMSLSSL